MPARDRLHPADLRHDLPDFVRRESRRFQGAGPARAWCRLSHRRQAGLAEGRRRRIGSRRRPRTKGRMALQRSTDRILTTHVGSLIRPPELLEHLTKKQSGQGFDERAYQACLAESVADVVRRQAEAGIDVVSDGEFGKSISWSQYVLERLSGFESRPIAGPDPFARGADRARFPEFYEELDARDGRAT